MEPPTLIGHQKAPHGMAQPCSRGQKSPGRTKGPENLRASSNWIQSAQIGPIHEDCSSLSCAIPSKAHQ